MSSNNDKQGSTQGVWRQLPASIWALGFVSMLMDISSEMIHSLLPLFLVTTLGSSALPMLSGDMKSTSNSESTGAF